MRELTFSCELRSSPEIVKDYVSRPALFLHVAAPLVKFSPVGSTCFPDVWKTGEYKGAMKLFGVLPIGWQAIVIELPNSEEPAHILTDRGYGPLLRTWEHRIEAHPNETRGTIYTDRLKLDAGVLTPIASIMVAQFFRHRQRRLRALDQAGFIALT